MVREGMVGAHLRRWDRQNANGGDKAEVIGRSADKRARPELTRAKLPDADLVERARV